MNHEQVAELLGAFALDAVDADEAGAVRDHLRSCPRCRDEVAQYHLAAGVLGGAGGDAPPGLWDGIAARLETAPPAGSMRRRRTRSPRWVHWGGPLLAVAAVVVIALLGVQVIRLGHEVNRDTSRLADQGLTAAAQDALLDPQAQRVELTGTGSHQSVAEIVALPSGAGYFFNRGLPPLPADHTYQLWAVTTGRAVSAGLIGARPTTVAFSLSPVPASSSFAVTVEPAGGSTGPTTPSVATGEV